MRVGSPIDEFETFEHSVPMLSLANVFSEKEFSIFKTISKRLVNINDFEYFCEPKMDGAAVSLIYKNGILEGALTREMAGLVKISPKMLRRLGQYLKNISLLKPDIPLYW